MCLNPIQGYSFIISRKRFLLCCTILGFFAKNKVATARGEQLMRVEKNFFDFLREKMIRTVRRKHFLRIAKTQFAFRCLILSKK